jgi:hypothetical protein
MPESHRRAVGDHELGCDGKPAPLQFDEDIAAVRRAFPALRR